MKDITMHCASRSELRNIFSRIIDAATTRVNKHVLQASWLDTKLGPMVAIADHEALYLLEFVDRLSLGPAVTRLRKDLNAAIIPGHTSITTNITTELNNYFAGKSAAFNTPLHLLGSAFQQQVWQTLMEIPLGATRSYSAIAHSIQKPTAWRAVANANGANRLAIIIPCHRVINANNTLGGYGGGIARKQWLLEHEQAAIAKHRKL